jgi:hypothetical protein
MSLKYAFLLPFLTTGCITVNTDRPPQSEVSVRLHKEYRLYSLHDGYTPQEVADRTCRTLRADNEVEATDMNMILLGKFKDKRGRVYLKYDLDYTCELAGLHQEGDN